MIYLGVTPVPLPRQNLVYDLRKLTELNAVDPGTRHDLLFTQSHSLMADLKSTQ